MFYLALLIAKLSSKLIKILHLGAGYTWPGYMASLLYPNLLVKLKEKYATKYIFITGTNGKTTTSKLLEHILTKENKKVIHNKSGANLLNGILSAMLLETSLFRQSKIDYCVFEIDELALLDVLKEIEPNILVLLNLSRDQLDRYGEIDTIVDKWVASLKGLKDTNLVLDSAQEQFGRLAKNYNGPVFYFDNDLESLHQTDLVGDYNAPNLNASLVVAGLLGIGKERCLRAVSDFSVAYGRGESVEYGGKLFQIYLAKNPVSFNNNLDLLNSGHVVYDSLVFLLNDEVRDGRDVSWIYDIDTPSLQKACSEKNIFIGGDRYTDMAVRLHYADCPLISENLSDDLQELFTVLTNIPTVKNIVILPNYSAMLQVRKHLTGKEIL